MGYGDQYQVDNSIPFDLLFLLPVIATVACLHIKKVLVTQLLNHLSPYDARTPRRDQSIHER
jgi:hypothetical protein